jgi:hypothetical protein
MSEEIWKDVVGFEGLYSVSNMGRVMRSSDSRNGHSPKGTILVQKFRGEHKKYLYVALGKGGKKHFPTVHRLVAMAFHGVQPPGRPINHIDANRLNNAADNLEWTTHIQNIAHAMRHGLTPRGDKQWRSRLRESEIPVIMERIKRNEPAPSIAADYGVAPGTIANIKYGNSWSWLTGVPKYRIGKAERVAA